MTSRKLLKTLAVSFTGATIIGEPQDAFVCELVQRISFFRSFDPLPDNGLLLARQCSKETLIRHLRCYLHEVTAALGISTRIVPHQLRHTYASELLRSGVSFPVLMKLLGHKKLEMTMQYLDIALTDLQREFHLARSQPRHLTPQPESASCFASCRFRWRRRFPSRRSTRDGDVPPCPSWRRFAPLPRSSLESSHQDRLPTSQTQHSRKIGRDWPLIWGCRKIAKSVTLSVPRTDAFELSLSSSCQHDLYRHRACRSPASLSGTTRRPSKSRAERPPTVDADHAA